MREARKEANENFIYLQTLEEFFLKIQDSSSDFKALQDIFQPLMVHLILIYQNSNFYNTPSRIVLLLREICNALIKRAGDFVPGDMVVQMMQNKDEIDLICQRL